MQTFTIKDFGIEVMGEDVGQGQSAGKSEKEEYMCLWDPPEIQAKIDADYPGGWRLPTLMELSVLVSLAELGVLNLGATKKIISSRIYFASNSDILPDHYSVGLLYALTVTKFADWERPIFRFQRVFRSFGKIRLVRDTK